MGLDQHKSQANIFSVSSLTSEIKQILEERYPFVWIQGEVSNLSRPSSGHMYFTLKDSRSQIASVLFKNQGSRLKFALENGLEITGLARLSVYEPRGTYQLIFEHIEPRGAGALQLAFEQLKAKLKEEGLFDDSHKKKLPFLPRRISVITSPSGAVIHDIIHVLSKRFSNLILEVVPVKVQGNQADKEIIAALSLLHSRNNTDVIIIARGGGSLEDLAPFNSELLARAIFAAQIPVVSAVGHETDFTICDFVSDLRAPTPSAAAEWTVPVKHDLSQHILGLRALLKSSMAYQLKQKKDQLTRINARIVDPKRKLIDKRLFLEDLTHRLMRTMEKSLRHSKDQLAWKMEKIVLVNPLKRLASYHDQLDRLRDRAKSSAITLIDKKNMGYKEIHARFQALNPSAILERGYSITRTLPPDPHILTGPDQVTTGQDVEVILSQGSLICSVKGIPQHGKEK